MDGDRKKRLPLKARPTQWKEKLRENCLKRVRCERSELLRKIRSARSLAPVSDVDKDLALRDIVSDEILRFNESPISEASWVDGRDSVPEGPDVDMLWRYEPQQNPELDSREYEDLMLAMEQALYEDFQMELKEREAAMLEEYEKTEALEDEMVDALLRESHISEHGVLCPICKRGTLQQEQQTIFCCCGLRLDTHNDHIGLEFLQNRLAELWQEHADSCKEYPQFLMGSQFGISALYLQCLSCSTFELVI